MPEVTQHAPGTFCWIELATTDVNAARAFYTATLGWDVSEVPMGESGFYYLLHKGGKDVGALYEMYPETRQQGVPPHWMSYVSVPSADDAAEKAKSLGGNVVAGPFDVFDYGRMAVIIDPQGASIAVWEPKAHVGLTIRDEDDTLCWNELLAKDVDAAKTFYTSMFGWSLKESPEYNEIYAGGNPVGGIMKSPMENVPPMWLPYFAVSDCDSKVTQVEAAGGRVYMPPRDLPGVGRFALVADPQGAAFYVIRLQLDQH